MRYQQTLEIHQRLVQTVLRLIGTGKYSHAGAGRNRRRFNPNDFPYCGCLA